METKKDGAASEGTAQRMVVWLKLRLWWIRFAMIAWRRWRTLSYAWMCAIASDDAFNEGETPRDAVLTEESYSDG